MTGSDEQAAWSGPSSSDTDLHFGDRRSSPLRQPFRETAEGGGVIERGEPHIEEAVARGALGGGGERAQQFARAEKQRVRWQRSGDSDAHAGRVGVPEFFASIFAALSINPAKYLMDGGRPVPIPDKGQPIAKLFA